MDRKIHISNDVKAIEEESYHTVPVIYCLESLEAVLELFLWSHANTPPAQSHSL